MSGYFGTEAQQKLQRKSDRLTAWMMNTPGACLSGRLIASDDPDRLGWKIIREHLLEDGVFSFRWVDRNGLERIKSETRDLGASVHGWDGFCNDSAALRPIATDLLTHEMPAGLGCRIADQTSVRALQSFFVDNAISPLSAAVLTGANCNTRSVLIADERDKIAAAGFVGMLQNRFSPLHDCAWLGLITCDPDMRGHGLGRRVTAELIRVALDDLGAGRVMGFAAASNAASGAMLRGCGLRPVNHASYVATLSATRFTA
ncbi:GNAT family N-acetyltransferase [Roseovarius sp. CAU 1744]|uniref:GNAT family N-acetyltransferase n=1 Tax=Roseovarius sp. CAU 1744 TaxID=3140368 RepID=UPI00325A6AEA